MRAPRPLHQLLRDLAWARFRPEPALASLHPFRHPRTGHIVDYKPPQPSPRHEWNPVTKRWQKQAALNRSAALARIADLEKGQHRTVRETLIRACHAVDAIKESLAPESQPVCEAVDRMYAALSRLELLETELGNLRADL